jgi:alpha-galactosidase
MPHPLLVLLAAAPLITLPPARPLETDRSSLSLLTTEAPAGMPAGDFGTRPFTESCALFGRFGPASRELPFSFDLDGKHLGPSLPGWKAASSERALDKDRHERTLVFTDPATGLQVRCVAVVYRDFPTVEWTVRFRNTGSADSPMLSNIQALDSRWSRPPSGEFRLHYEFGTFFPLSPTDFMPQEAILGPGESRRLIPLHGRPSGGIMPYFNLERGDGSGAIIVVGWPGAWAIDFARDGREGLRVSAGQELTHLRLHPGEEIRTPLMVVQFWRGDWIGAQNTWRRWMLGHNLPRTWGHSVRPLITPSSSLQYGEMILADEASQINFIDRYRAENIPIDCWWMDAGWYENHGRWQEPIAWRADRARFPHGLRSITDHAHGLGLKSIVWFEPERVMPSNSLFRTHPEWLLPNRTGKTVSRLLYLGNPDALRWITDTVDKVITEEGIDVYRQDFNVVAPVDLWRSNDAPDRQGIIENHHLEGYLAFWDELLRRHPGLVIDSCAGGGSRNDLETMRRALPFYRSDYRFDADSNQTQTSGLALWLPFFGTGTGDTGFSPYELRSNMACPLVIPGWDMRDRKLPYDGIRKAVAQWRSYADCYLGDFYPLTPCRLESDVWIAWQFDVPEAGRGVVQAFRRADSPYDRATFRLRGLVPGRRYRIDDPDRPGPGPVMAGRELMERGLEVDLPVRHSAAILLYGKVE